jgi:hypothetical protein
MKRTIPVMVIFLFLSLANIHAVTSTPQIQYKITVETAFTNPYPAEPGKDLELSIVVSNEGNSGVKNIIVELEPTEPFALLETPTKEISSLNVGDSRIIDYKLFVDGSAVSTTYDIPVRIKYDGNEIKKNVQVRVQGKPKFKLLSLSSDTINPGDEAEILVKIENVGSGEARRVTVTFSSTSDYVKPVFSGGTVYVGDVKHDEEKTVRFKVIASPDSEYGVYSGYVNVSYEDESGNELSENFEVGILISGSPKLQVFKSEVDTTKKELSVEIVNIGSAEARAIKARLLINNETFDVDYVTAIKIDKRSTLKFMLPSVTKGKLELSYEGPDNKKYTQLEELSWSIPFSIPTWVWIIVFLVVVYFIWKKKLWKR